MQAQCQGFGTKDLFYFEQPSARSVWFANSSAVGYWKLPVYM
jgi:hypothetical protein